MLEECHQVNDAEEETRETYAVDHFHRIFRHACKHYPCYQKLYAEAGVLELEIKSCRDIAKIPIIDKAWARKHFEEFKGAYRLNTGGSSGEPTAFWADKNCWAREI